MGWYRKYKFIKPHNSPWTKSKKVFQGYVSKDRKYIYQTKEACLAHIKHGSARLKKLTTSKAKK